MLVALIGATWLVAGSSSPAAASSPAPSDPLAFTVYHGDAAGRGVVTSIRAVDTASRAWTSPALDGQIYGEPLVAFGHVYVATENDTVYALSTATGAIEWSRHLGTAVSSGSLPCGDITPEVGITGTPVIDESRHEIFVVADETVNGSPSHRLVGLNLATGMIQMTDSVDPPGSDTAALLQRTGLTLSDGKVVFAFGGNFGDCSTYHGWIVGVAETGGTPGDFEVDSAAGDDQGAIWMGGAAPAVDSKGNIWAEAGNGSVTSPSDAYDDSDSVLELSPSLKLEQFFAPITWASDNATDLDLSMEPVLFADGEVLAAGKSRHVELLDGKHLGGIGGEQAEISSVCSEPIDGGSAVVGTTAYLPCLSGIIAVQIGASPPSLRLRWSSGTGGGPPLVVAGLAWTIGQNGELSGLDLTTGKERQEASIGVPANHFPTPSAGDGLLLAASADNVVAFRTTPTSTSTTTTTPGVTSTSTTAASSTSTAVRTGRQRATSHKAGSGLPIAVVALIVVAGVAAGGGVAWLVSRRRRTASPGG